MAQSWQDYQTKAVGFFQKLGFDAKLNHKVVGARATHTVDAWVTYSRFGIKVKWLVECKLWNTAIPKEKVMALMQIAQDVGADKAFLLSEKGFQSGAINAVRNTNIVLSSLETLKANASQEMWEYDIVISAKHLDHLNERVRELMYDRTGELRGFSGLNADDVVSALAVAFELQGCVSKALVQNYPVVFVGDRTEGFKRYDNAKSFSKRLKEDLNYLEAKTVTLEARARKNEQSANNVFLDALKNLVVSSEKALFDNRDRESGFKDDRLAVLASMKELGKAFDAVRGFRPSKKRSEALRELWKTICDTIYPHLTEPKIPRTVWESAKKTVAAKVERYVDSVAPET